MSTLRTALGAGAALCVAVAGTCGTATASPAKVNTLALSGQLKGTMSVNTSLTCPKGNLGMSNGVSRVAELTLSDKNIPPMSGSWQLQIDFTRTGTTKFLKSDNEIGASFSATSEEKVVYVWIASSGTFTISSNYEQGKLSLVLMPGTLPSQAKTKEVITGSWDCN